MQTTASNKIEMETVISSFEIDRLYRRLLHAIQNCTDAKKEYNELFFLVDSCDPDLRRLRDSWTRWEGIALGFKISIETITGEFPGEYFCG